MYIKQWASDRNQSLQEETHHPAHWFWRLLFCIPLVTDDFLLWKAWYANHYFNTPSEFKSWCFYLLSIECADWSRLRDMYEACCAKIWQLKFPVGFPVKVCGLNLLFISICNDIVVVRIESGCVIKAKHVSLLCNYFVLKIFLTRNRTNQRVKKTCFTAYFKPRYRLVTFLYYFA